MRRIVPRIVLRIGRTVRQQFRTLLTASGNENRRGGWMDTCLVALAVNWSDNLPHDGACSINFGRQPAEKTIGKKSKKKLSTIGGPTERQGTDDRENFHVSL